MTYELMNFQTSDMTLSFENKMKILNIYNWNTIMLWLLFSNIRTKIGVSYNDC